MGDGADGGAIITAVEVVVEELNTGTELVALHPHNVEGTLALGHHRNQLAAICMAV